MQSWKINIMWNFLPTFFDFSSDRDIHFFVWLQQTLHAMQSASSKKFFQIVAHRVLKNDHQTSHGNHFFSPENFDDVKQYLQNLVILTCFLYRKNVDHSPTVKTRLTVKFAGLNFWSEVISHCSKLLCTQNWSQFMSIFWIFPCKMYLTTAIDHFLNSTRTENY